MIPDKSPAAESTMEDFPRPRAPLLPPLSGSTAFGRRYADLPAVTDLAAVVCYASGAAAIAMALRAAGIGVGHRVLVPAYHCASMIEPVRAVGAEPILYRLTSTLAADMRDLETHRDAAVRALLITHYFGFPQDTPALRAFCDQRGLVLIEDCAHAWFGRFADRPPGAFGDYAVASVRKFFPVPDGGLLVSARRPLPASVAGVTMAADIKAGIDVLEESFGYGRLGALYFLLGPVLALKTAVWRAVKAWRQRLASVPAATVGRAYAYIDPDAVARPMTRTARGLMRLGAAGRIVARRRRHYRRIAMALEDLAGARPLHPELPESVVPYMFPVLIDRPEAVFAPLKTMGVPIWRWDALRDTGCPVADRYGQSLFQLPCHQELRDRELEWMIKSLCAVLAHSSATDAQPNHNGNGSPRELDNGLVHPPR